MEGMKTCNRNLLDIYSNEANEIELPTYRPVESVYLFVGLRS